MPSNQDILISIITPSYNRAHTLNALYASLLAQEFTKFEWILVDDGSTDNTNELVNRWIEDNYIHIRYYKIANAGKTKAVYFGLLQQPKGEYTFVLDSDDYLAYNALNLIADNLYALASEFVGLVGLKSYKSGELLGSKFYSSTGSYIDIYYCNKAVTGDKLFILRTGAYKDSYTLPLADEYFIPESLTFANANRFGIYKCINNILYHGDYLEEGLTQNGFRLLVNNLRSHVFEKRELQKMSLPLKHKALITMYYIYFCMLAKMNLKNVLAYSGSKLFTLLLYMPTVIYLSLTKKLRKL